MYYKAILKSIATGLALLIICGCSSGGVVSSNQSVTVPLYYSSESPTEMHAQINLGGNQLYASLDTGSVGLRILASRLTNMNNIQVSSTPVTFSYASGVILSGVVARAPFTIGGISQNLQFMLVESVSCDSRTPDCNRGFGQGFSSGVMGVRLDNYSDPQHDNLESVWSPLAQLPGNYGSGFIVSNTGSKPYLTIGLDPGNLSGFNFLKLDRVIDNSAIYPLWDVGLQGNFQVNDSVPSSTQSFLFDTGTPSSVFYSGVFQPVGEISRGTRIAYNLHDNYQHSITLNQLIGSQTWVNAGISVAESFGLGINTGINPYVDYNIAYDIKNGQIGFKATGNLGTQ